MNLLSQRDQDPSAEREAVKFKGTTPRSFSTHSTRMRGGIYAAQSR